jgi:hypothetical protein
MKNQDMPANPATRTEKRNTKGFGAVSCDVSYIGETKREKAFWQVFSAMLGHPDMVNDTYDGTANNALEAVNAGFRALENDDG